MTDHAQPGLVPGNRWNPMMPQAPAESRLWIYCPPPGWPASIPAEDHLPQLPAPPAGHRFWRERWRKWPALGSLITGITGIAISTNGSVAAILFGLVILTAVVAAGWISKFWFHVTALSSGRRAFVWAVAIPGIVTGIWCLWVLMLITKDYSRR